MIMLVVNIPAIFIQYNTVKKIETTMIKYAQKNGGFIAGEQDNPQKILEEMLAENRLTDKITQISFEPSLGEMAQRHNKIEIEMILEETLSIPFNNEEITINVPIKTDGFSHKYYKENE